MSQKIEKSDLSLFSLGDSIVSGAYNHLKGLRPLTVSITGYRNYFNLDFFYDNHIKRQLTTE